MVLRIMSDDDSTAISDYSHVDYFYSALDRCAYVMIEDRNGYSVLLTPREALALLNWLQVQHGYIDTGAIE